MLATNTSKLFYQREEAEWLKLLLCDDKRTHREDGVEKKRNSGVLRPKV